MSRPAVLIVALLLLAAVPVSIAQQGGPGGGAGGPPDGTPGDDRGNRTGGNGSGERGSSGHAGPPARNETRNVTYPHEVRVGEFSLVLDEDELVNVTIGNTTLFTSILVPGLDPVDVITRQGNAVTIQGERARVDLQTQGRLSLVVRTDAGGLQATLAPGVEADEEQDNKISLSAGSVHATVQAERLMYAGDRIQSDGRLQLVAGNASETGPPAWARPQAAPATAGLPYAYDGRYLSFTLTKRGLENVSVHGVSLGSAQAEVASLDQVRITGARVHMAGGNLTLDALDTPRTLVRVQAPGLTHDLPQRTSLPSGATILVTGTEENLTIAVEPPRAAVTGENATVQVTEPARVAALTGGSPGVRAEADGSALSVESPVPAQLKTRFKGTVNDTTGEVTLELGLVRALLVKDLDGDGQVDIGEPAVAASQLTGGRTEVDGQAVASTFQLWSGNLTVVSEPGAHAVKLTYLVEDLQAPPGTLFVLESAVRAPPGSQLQANPNGVTVRNGSVAATYSATGPVTVDGEPAWAQRSVLLQPDGTVHILLTYPAGDDLVHDPTIQVQSVGTALTGLVSAAPSAVVAGALAGLLLVGASVFLRRRGRP